MKILLNENLVTWLNFIQMKCDAVNASEEEEEEEDEEILYLKKELERKRWEKRQRKNLQEQAAFSDEATQSTASEPSMQTNSSSESLWLKKNRSTQRLNSIMSQYSFLSNTRFCDSHKFYKVLLNWNNKIKVHGGEMLQFSTDQNDG